MERRVLIAITLSFLVLFLFQRFVMPPPAPPATAPEAVGTTPGQPGATSPGLAPAPPAPAVIGTAPGVPAVGGAAAPETLAPAGPAIVVGDTAEREIVVETTTVRAVFSNRGGRILHWVLKSYRSDSGTPLDLVPEGAGADAIKPFSLGVDDPALTARINGGIYRVTVAGGAEAAQPLASDAVDATAFAQTITFELAASDGLNVTKTFAIDPAGYVLGFSTVVQAGGTRLNPSIHWGPGLGDDIARAPPASFFSPSYNTPAQALIYKDGDFERVTPATAGSQEGAFRFAGVSDHYFASLLLNEDGAASFRIDYAPVHVPQASDPALIGNYVGYALRFPAPPEQTRFFFGPKAFDDLRAIDTELVRAIHFGFFSWLAVPLLGALQWVHGFVGNWGWSIVVLTVLINLAMFPLRHKSVVSMRKMQELQPQMKAIQDRYAKYKITDPERQKMNTEVMELYKTKGVNPASGCVPMLLTMPFLFAFYSMLSVAIEIRGAHFVGWITNLSGPDPFFISPLIMGATMFWQQKMMPTTMDPAQAKIMMFMPIMFTFMSLSFPSGLVVYWTVSNVWTIGQQYFTNYLIGAPPPRAAK
jgi:YidC/Oxa1 family membrane protein insertase